MNLYKRVLLYIKPYWHVLLAAIVCTVLAAGGNLYLPWIFRDMIDDVLNAKDAFRLPEITALNQAYRFVFQDIQTVGDDIKITLRRQA